jgi:hypothetical protein
MTGVEEEKWSERRGRELMNRTGNDEEDKN